MNRLRYVRSNRLFHCKFTAECASERIIMKIGQYSDDVMTNNLLAYILDHHVVLTGITVVQKNTTSSLLHDVVLRTLSTLHNATCSRVYIPSAFMLQLIPFTVTV